MGTTSRCSDAEIEAARRFLAAAQTVQWSER
jgi:hypothetical protein